MTEPLRPTYEWMIHVREHNEAMRARADEYKIDVEHCVDEHGAEKFLACCSQVEGIVSVCATAAEAVDEMRHILRTTWIDACNDTGTLMGAPP